MIEERDNKGRFAKGRISAKRRGKFVKCERCGKEVYKPKVHLMKHKRHFCSIDCWNEQQYKESISRKRSVCVVCGCNFISCGKIHKPNGKRYWSITCSMKCRKKREESKIVYKKCKYCGKKIRCYQCIKERKNFCSYDCSNAYKTAQQTFKANCLSCGKELTLPISKNNYVENFYCSRGCMDGFRKALNSPSWKGGWYLDGKEVMRINVGMSKKTYKGHPYGHPIYRARYRVVIELAIGQYLPRNRPVFHLNGDTLDDRVSNLYICSSPTQIGKFLQGTLETPSRSNVGYEAIDGKIDYLRLDDETIRKFIQDSGVSL